MQCIYLCKKSRELFLLAIFIVYILEMNSCVCFHYVDVLKKYFNKQGRQLELFARSLLPEWTSWGNEVHVHVYTYVNFTYIVYYP